MALNTRRAIANSRSASLGQVVDVDPVPEPRHEEIDVVLERVTVVKDTFVVPTSRARTGSARWPGAKTAPSAASTTTRTADARPSASTKTSWSFMVPLTMASGTDHLTTPGIPKAGQSGNRPINAYNTRCSLRRRDHRRDP